MVPMYHRIRRAVNTALDDLSHDGRGWILTIVSAGWFLSIGVRYVYPSILPFLRTEFNMDLTIAGLLLSALWIAYALGQFPGGVLGDRIGEGNILVISTAISSVAILLVALSVNIWMLFVASIAFGFATALYAPMRFTIFTEIYDDHAGTAVGLTMAAGSIGNTVLPAGAVLIATYMTWRLGLGLLVPLFVLVMISLWIVVPSRTSSSSNEDSGLSMDSLLRLLSETSQISILVVVLIHILLAFVSQGFLGFYPTYLVEMKGFSPRTASVLYGLYFAAGIVIQPLVGMSKDRFGSKRTLLFVSGAFFLGLFALQVGHTVLHFAFLTVLLSHRNGAGVVTNTFIADSLSADIKGSGLGFLRTSWILIGALSPIFVGYLGDLGFLSRAYLLLAGLAGIATVLAIFAPIR